MKDQYAVDQPTGSKNHVENIAIVGAGGQVGMFIAKALIESGRHHVTAITRPDSSSSMPDGLHATKKVNYDDHASLVEALTGEELLIITMSVFAPKATSIRLIDAAVEARVKWIVPNEWGIDHAQKGVGKDTMLGDGLLAIRNHIEKVGGNQMHWISVACGFWYEFSLAGTEARYGFNFEKKRLTLYDDGNTKIITTTWPQVGRGVANLLSLKVLPEDKNDTSLTLSKYKNAQAYISSFFISQQDMFASVLRVLGDREKDWTISHEDVKERYQRGVKMLNEGNMVGFGILLYARDFYPDGSGDFSDKLDNERLGLPNEDLDEATKVAVKMAKDGSVK